MNAAKDLVTAILTMLTAHWTMLDHTHVPVTMDTWEMERQAASHDTQEARLVTFLSKYQDELFYCNQISLFTVLISYAAIMDSL